MDERGVLRAPGSPVVPRANDVYAGIRLLYEPRFEDAFLERRTAFQLARVVVPCCTVGLIAAAVALGVAQLAGVFDDRDVADQRALAAAIGFVAFGVGFLAWSIRRKAMGISSWQVVVDGRARAADAAIRELRTELMHRLSGARVTVSDVKRNGRWVLRVRLRTYRCYVSIFPFGTDLFVGWAMLEEPNFWNVLGGWLSDLVRGRTWFRRELRSYAPKALRDVVHHSTRVAVAVAATRPERGPSDEPDQWSTPDAPVPAPGPPRPREGLR
jgi:hypothetical protein